MDRRKNIASNIAQLARKLCVYLWDNIDDVLLLSGLTMLGYGIAAEFSPGWACIAVGAVLIFIAMGGANAVAASAEALRRSGHADE